MILLKIFTILLGIWFIIFIIAALYNKFLLIQGRSIKHPYELFAGKKHFSITKFSLNPFFLAWFIVLRYSYKIDPTKKGIYSATFTPKKIYYKENL